MSVAASTGRSPHLGSHAGLPDAALRARPAFRRSVSAGLDALAPVIGRLGLPGVVDAGVGDLIVTSALRSYGFTGAAAAPAAGAPAPAAATVQAVVPAAAIAAAEAALHEAVQYARGRHLYGATVLDIPHARSLLASALADTVAADALSSAALRTAETGVPAAATAVALSAHLTCLLLGESVLQLSVLAGSTFYARIEPFEVLEEFARDVPALAVLVPALRDPLSSVGADLAPWCDAAHPAAPGSLDAPGLADAIAAHAPGAAGVHAELVAMAAVTRVAARRLDVDAAAATSVVDLAHRLSLLAAAAAVVRSWAEGRGTGAVAGDPVVLEAVLRRIAGRLARRQPPLPAACVERLVAHAESCVDDGVAVGLSPVRLNTPSTVI